MVGCLRALTLVVGLMPIVLAAQSSLRTIEVTGRLIEPCLGELTKQKITLEAIRNGRRISFRASTDEHARFRFTEVRPGFYELHHAVGLIQTIRVPDNFLPGSMDLGTVAAFFNVDCVNLPIKQTIRPKPRRKRWWIFR